MEAGGRETPGLEGSGLEAAGLEGPGDMLTPGGLVDDWRSLGCGEASVLGVKGNLGETLC